MIVELHDARCAPGSSPRVLRFLREHRDVEGAARDRSDVEAVELDGGLTKLGRFDSAGLTALDEKRRDPSVEHQDWRVGVLGGGYEYITSLATIPRVSNV